MFLITLIIITILLLNFCDSNDVGSDDFIKCIQKEKVLDTIVSDSIVYIEWEKGLKNNIVKHLSYSYIGSKNIKFVSMSDIFINQIREYFIVANVTKTKNDKYKIELIYRYNPPNESTTKYYLLVGKCDEYKLIETKNK